MQFGPSEQVRRRIELALWVALISCLLFAVRDAALGDPPAAAPAPAPTAAAVAPTGPDSPPASALGETMEHNGNSLFRAEDIGRNSNDASAAGGAPSDQPSGSLVSVSFFAVAPEKPKTYKKHDLVTVIAKEDSSFTANGTAQETRTQDINSQLNAFIALRPSLNQLHSIISGGSTFPQIQNQNEDDFKGQGEVDRTDSLSDRFTAEVVDVKPNGTLVLQAVKQIKIDEEQVRMVLTGICRVEDVTADNSVLTTQLFNLNMTTTHSGLVRDASKRGLLSRLLDIFNPF
jgi:flagellar L-ring protein precursor FlgH